MKSLIIASSIAVATLVSSAALAAPPAATPAPIHATMPAKEHTTTGVVKSYSTTTRRLLLKNGYGYTVDASVAPADFKKGDKVDIRWTVNNKIRAADRVTLKN